MIYDLRTRRKSLVNAETALQAVSRPHLRFTTFFRQNFYWRDTKAAQNDDRAFVVLHDDEPRGAWVDVQARWAGMKAARTMERGVRGEAG